MIWGIVSDRFRTIKKILIFLLIGQMITAFFILKLESFSSLVIVMFLFYFFQQPMIPLSDSLTLLTIRNTNKSYTSFRLWGSTGFALAALAFGILEYFSIIQIKNTISLLLLTLIVSFFFVFFVKDQQGSQSKMNFSGLVNVVRSKKLIFFMVLVFILAASHKVNDNFLSLYLSELGANKIMISVAFLFAALSEIPIFMLLSKYSNKVKELPLLAFAGIAYFIKYVLMVLFQDPYIVIVVQLLHSITFGIFFITSIQYLTTIIPDAYRSSGQALHAIVWSGLAGILGGIMGGFIYDTYGSTTLYIAAGVLGVVAAAGFFITHLIEEA